MLAALACAMMLFCTPSKTTLPLPNACATTCRPPGVFQEPFLQTTSFPENTDSTLFSPKQPDQVVGVVFSWRGRLEGNQSWFWIAGPAVPRRAGFIFSQARIFVRNLFVPTCGCTGEAGVLTKEVFLNVW